MTDFFTCELKRHQTSVLYQTCICSSLGPSSEDDEGRVVTGSRVNNENVALGKLQLALSVLGESHQTEQDSGSQQNAQFMRPFEILQELFK